MITTNLPIVCSGGGGIYIHIPFCKRVCPFCSFSVLKDRDGSLHTAFASRILEEIASFNHATDSYSVNSIYFGGGTPSRLSVETIAAILFQIHQKFRVTSDCCISFELNPEDVSAEYLDKLEAIGINRLSIGIQCFDDHALKFLGRNHSAKESFNAAEIAATSNIPDFNLDLLYGFPGFDTAFFERQARHFADFQPTHISLYALTLEQGTPFYRKKRIRDWVGTNDEVIVETFECCLETLGKVGLEIYEVSNLAKQGYRSRQNLIYWNNADYLGFGPGAHSKAGKLRFWNYRDLSEWMKEIDNGNGAIAEIEEIGLAERTLECLFVNLRRAETLLYEDIRQKWRLDFSKLADSDILRDLSNRGFIYANAKGITPSRKGLLMADEISLKLQSLL